MSTTHWPGLSPDLERSRRDEPNGVVYQFQIKIKTWAAPLEPALPKLRGDPSSAYSEPLSTPYSWYTTEIDRSPQAESAGETLDLFRLKPAVAGRTAAKSLLRCLHERARAPLEHLYEAAHGPGWSLACALAWAVACL